MKCVIVSDMKQKDIFLIYSQQPFVGLRDVFSVTISSPPKHAISCLPRRLEDVLKKSWKMRNCYDLEKPFLTSTKEIVIIIE